MKPIGHAIVSITAASILYQYTHSIAGFIWFVACGTLIDADHYIDYVRECGVSFNPKKVYHSCKNGYKTFKKIVIIFHSYELVIILWLAIFIFNLGIVWAQAALGLTLHMFVDTLVNPLLPSSYFFLYRAMHNYETKEILK
tara:strand:- start:2 stop:424 length:423 start_codon:yes stop_codon:yes gene_type:complete